MLGKFFMILIMGLPKGTEKGVLFTYFAPDAQSVYLVGDFNNWNTSANPMKKNEDGVWSITLPLPPGKYQYKFFVDGRYEADPTNPITEGPYGNSVIRIGQDFRVLPPEMTNNTPMNSYVTFSERAKGFLCADKDTTGSYRLFTIATDVRMGVNVNIQEEATLTAILHYNTQNGQDLSTHQIPFYFERAKLNFDKGDLHFISFYNTFAYESPDPVTIIGNVNQFNYPLGREEEGLVMKIEKPLNYSIHTVYSNNLLTGRDIGFVRLAKEMNKIHMAFFTYLNHGNNIEYQVISPDSERLNDTTFLHFNTYEDRLLFGLEWGRKDIINYEFIWGNDVKRANYYDVDGTKTQQVPTNRKWNIGKIYKFRAIYGNKSAFIFGDLERHKFDSLFYETLGRGYSTLKIGGKITSEHIDVELNQNFLFAGSVSTKWDALFREIEINRLKYLGYPLVGYKRYIYFHIEAKKTLFKRARVHAAFSTARYAINQPPRTDEVLFTFKLPIGRFGSYYDMRYFHIKSGYLHTDKDFFDHYIELYYRPSRNIKLKAGYGFYPYNLLDEHTARIEQLWNTGIGISQIESNFKGLGGLIEEGENTISKNRKFRLWLELSF